MDQGYISALAALSGTIVGGMTSFLTSWSTQHSQFRAQRIAAETTKREKLFGRFLDEMARLYSVAISEETVNYGRLVEIFALKGRICLFATQPVIDTAERAVKQLIDLHLAPNWSTEQMRAMLDDGGQDPLKNFADACRIELRDIGNG
jgi:hypothetical protein